MKTSWSPRFVCILCLFLAIAIFLAIAPATVSAASAQWVGSQSNNWNDPANWNPNTVPNGPADTATFSFVSASALVTANTEVNEIILNGANGLTIQTQSGSILTLSGVGIINNGPSAAYLVNGSQNDRYIVKVIRFTNNATAGRDIIITNYGANNVTGELGPLAVEFHNNSNAGSVTIFTHGGQAQEATTEFYDLSSAADATMINLHSEGEADGGSVRFHDSSTAGNASIENEANHFELSGHGFTVFDDSSSAGNAIIRNYGSLVRGFAEAGFCSFTGHSTAANAFIINNGGVEAGAGTFIGADSTAANATIVSNGPIVANGRPGSASIFGSAGNATLIANQGQFGGGRISIFGSSPNSTARIAVFGNGDFEASGSAVGIGSIEGDGFIILYGASLNVGSNNLSTTFSGVIEDADGFTNGALVKVGAGTLTLANANTYTGPTTITSGKLKAAHDEALGEGDLSLTESGAILSLEGGVTNDYIFDQAILNVVTGCTVNLNYKGSPDVVGFLVVNGISQPAGLYGGPASGAPNQRPQFTGAGTILVTTPIAVSRKMQAAMNFDTNLPFTGAPAIECRAGGMSNAYKLVAMFGFPITFDSASVTSGAASIANISGNGTDTVTVELINVMNAQDLTVTLSGVNYGVAMGDLPIRMSVLIADTDGNGSVNSSDIAQTKAQSGHAVNSSNFREDVSGNGVINASDVSLVKTRCGTALPSMP